MVFLKKNLEPIWLGFFRVSRNWNFFPLFLCRKNFFTHRFRARRDWGRGNPRFDCAKEARVFEVEDNVPSACSWEPRFCLKRPADAEDKPEERCRPIWFPSRVTEEPAAWTFFVRSEERSRGLRGRLRPVPNVWSSAPIWFLWWLPIPFRLSSNCISDLRRLSSSTEGAVSPLRQQEIRLTADIAAWSSAPAEHDPILFFFWLSRNSTKRERNRKWKWKCSFKNPTTTGKEIFLHHENYKAGTRIYVISSNELNPPSRRKEEKCFKRRGLVSRKYFFPFQFLEY